MTHIAITETRLHPARVEKRLWKELSLGIHDKNFFVCLYSLDE